VKVLLIPCSYCTVQKSPGLHLPIPHRNCLSFSSRTTPKLPGLFPTCITPNRPKHSIVLQIVGEYNVIQSFAVAERVAFTESQQETCLSSCFHLDQSDWWKASRKIGITDMSGFPVKSIAWQTTTKGKRDGNSIELVVKIPVNMEVNCGIKSLYWECPARCSHTYWENQQE